MEQSTEIDRPQAGHLGTHAAIIEALHHVPPAHLTIYDLARDLIDQDGNVATLRATERAEEIEAAVDQARAYVGDTQAVLKQVGQLIQNKEVGREAPHQELDELGDIEEEDQE